MIFRTSMELLNEKQNIEAYDFTLCDILAVVGDVFNEANIDIKNAHIPGADCLERIRVGDEKNFIKLFIKLTTSFYRMYTLNEEQLFSKEKLSKFTRDAIDNLKELNKRISDLNEDFKEYEDKLIETEQVNNVLNEKLQQQGSLKEQYEKLERVNSTYQEKLMEHQRIKEEIEKYSASLIPELDKDIGSVEQQLEGLKDRYTELDKKHGIVLGNANDIEQKCEEKEKEVKTIENQNKKLTEDLKNKNIQKNELEKSNEALTNEIDQIKSDIADLQQKKVQIDVDKKDLDSERLRLVGEIDTLEADKIYWESERTRVHGLHDEVQEDCDKIKAEVEDIEKRRIALEQEITQYKEQCTRENDDIVTYNQQLIAYQQKLTTINNDREERHRNITEQTIKLENSRIDSFIEKINLERVLCNFRVQQTYIHDKQERISKDINYLLKDNVLDESWMYPQDKNLMDYLERTKADINEKIKEEMIKLEQALVRLEEG